MSKIQLAAGVLALLLVGCGDEGKDEPQPYFTCTPQPADARGCGPITAFGYSAGEPGTTYPVGCRVVFPVENPFYGTKQSCTCDESGPGGELGWLCAG